MRDIQVVAEGRSVDAILADWRSLERERDGMSDGPGRAAVDALIVDLREEHRRALAEREAEASSLGSRP